ncbi:CBO0543 family protein [Bacillus sp. UNC438CL73TsuS30]|uniref:CBO0543 family protein n=1 Tax=Bacillus sp. UNC438CL73TsuS30 TaxID=1340434 RepID=UPI0004798BF6|nr:CBO0543 family protein [Bacillus sp. UNC438CL73TsuS30]
MLVERIILVAMWLTGFICLMLFIPRNDRRKGILALLIFQAFIWLCDLPSFQLNLLKAPVREFPKATDLPFTIDYFFYPVLFSIYYVHKKKKGSFWSRMIPFLVWVSIITLYDSVLERYTDLLEYDLLPWYGMWIYIGFLFYMSQVCCNWFFKDKNLFQSERWGSE